MAALTVARVEVKKAKCWLNHFKEPNGKESWAQALQHNPEAQHSEWARKKAKAEKRVADAEAGAMQFHFACDLLMMYVFTLVFFIFG